jgi:hypothetical protein
LTDQEIKLKIQNKMYRRQKFLEVLHEIREEMSREADYDVELFVEMVRSEKNFDIEIEMTSDETKKLTAKSRSLIKKLPKL